MTSPRSTIRAVNVLDTCLDLERRWPSLEQLRSTERGSLAKVPSSCMHLRNIEETQQGPRSSCVHLLAVSQSSDLNVMLVVFLLTRGQKESRIYTSFFDEVWQVRCYNC